MKPALVTGATGFVGWHIARRLLDRGERVRVLVRDETRLRELDAVEARLGDVRDGASVKAAAEGCCAIYHAAADYRLWVRNPAEMHATNVEGTRNVLAAAARAGVDRIVYTSTVGCIGIPRDGLGTEETPVSADEMTGAYKRSKFHAEEVALEYAQKGLPVVIVNPTAPVGDHDFKPTPTGRIVVNFLRGKMPAFLDTGLNFVDVVDVAEGHLLAGERGNPGERYILGHRNLHLREVFDILEDISGVPAPRREIPYGFAYAAGILSTAWANLTGCEPLAPLDAVRMARKKMFVSSEKARRDLGYTTAPLEVALVRAVKWFRENGYAT